jgi:putative endonuclease
MEERQSYVYILASERNGTLYVGVTADLIKRIWFHKEKINNKSFTKKYGVSKLVYYECFDDISQAIQREKCLKRYKRSWKIELIEERNLFWKDLFDEVCGG